MNKNNVETKECGAGAVIAGAALVVAVVAQYPKIKTGAKMIAQDVKKVVQREK